jgi:hypothetical protein
VVPEPEDAAQAFPGFGLLLLFLASVIGMAQVAKENIKLARAQNMASTAQAEISARDLHGPGGKPTELAQQFRA